MAVVARDALEPVRLGLHRMQRMLANRRSWTSLAEAAGADLPQQAIQVLQHLQDGSPKSVAELARLARMDAAAVSRQIRWLEEQGLVARRPSANHGRVVLIEPTPSGFEMAQRLHQRRDQHLADALAEWTPEEIDTVGRLMLRLVDDLQRTPHRLP